MDELNDDTDDDDNFSDMAYGNVVKMKQCRIGEMVSGE